MLLRELKLLHPNQLLPMFPATDVTHVAGLDQSEPRP
jgi:hypothetical protein